VLAFELTGEALKSVMQKLLKGSAFDEFFVRGVEIFTITKFEISGILNPAYCGESEEKNPPRSYCLWSELKRYAFDLIKGNKKPQFLKIIFALPPDKVTAIHENAAALFLNVSFLEGKLTFTTAVCQKNFSLDKSLELKWEEYVRNFFESHSWPVSTLI
jgi:hypothetical protein